MATAYVLSYAPVSETWHKVTTLKNGDRELASIRWAQDGNSLIGEWRGTKLSTDIKPCAYRQEGSQWVESDQLPLEVCPTLVWHQPAAQREVQGKNYGKSWAQYPKPQPCRCSNGLEITLEESPDEPQRLVASIGIKKITLVDRDPRLAGIEIAPSRQIEWRTPDGQLHRGLLTLPLHPSSSPPPLVVQIYCYMPNVFRPDGMTQSGFSKQALAARGIAVLEMSAIDSFDSSDVRHEIAKFREDFDCGIDQLLESKLVDPFRLGCAGFSHTGIEVRALLMQPGRHKIEVGATKIEAPDRDRGFHRLPTVRSEV